MIAAVPSAATLRRCCALLLLALLPQAVWAFAEDLCPVVTGGWRTCALRPCNPDDQRAACTSISMLTTVASQAGAALQGSGARSSVHVDATYYLAQAAGFTPRDAYALVAYSEAVDLGRFVLRDERGRLVSDPDDCPPLRDTAACRLLTPRLGGTNRNNFEEGGVFFHFMAPPAAVKRNPDGLAPQLADAQVEPFLYNLREWVYGRGPLCVGGLVQHGPRPGCFADTSRSPPQFVGHIPFLSGTRADAVDWVSPITEQPLVTDPGSDDNRPASELSRFVPPAQVPLARLGIYVHAVQDRVSHHRCIDASRLEGPRPAGAGEMVLNPLPFAAYEGPRAFGSLHELFGFLRAARLRADPDYVFRFDATQCTQSLHAERHVIETGVDPRQLDPADRTTEPALRLTLAVLQDYARDHGLPVPRLAPAQTRALIAGLMGALETPDATGRILALDRIASDQRWLPLPGYGGVDVEIWDRRAGRAWFEPAAAPAH